MTVSLYQVQLKSARCDKWLEIRAVDMQNMTFTIYDCDLGEQIIPATDVENGERMLKRLHYQNRNILRCGNCGGSGYRIVDEGPEYGGPMRDACYHCSNTGEIDHKTWFQDRIQQAASVIASSVTENQIRSANSNPDGEGFAFQAAENGMREYEYRQACYYENEGRAVEALGLLMDRHHSVLRSIVEQFSPAPVPRFKGEVHVKWVSHRRNEQQTHYGLTIAFDEPTASFIVETLDGKYVWVHQDSLAQIESHEMPVSLDPDGYKIETPRESMSIAYKEVPPNDDDIPF